MEILTQDKINSDIEVLLKKIEDTQWKEKKINIDKLLNLPIITREDLRNTKMEKGFIT